MTLVNYRADVPITWRAMPETDGIRRLSGIATTPAVDRMGDQVLPRGGKVELPIPLLWNHDPERRIGRVVTASISDDGIEVTAEFVPTESDRINQIIWDRWAEMKAGLVGYLSIGFNAKGYKPGKSGRVFTDWEMLEVSAVPIPANRECAITSVRAYEPASCAALPRPVAVPAGAKTMNTAERVAALKSQIADRRDRVNTLANSDALDDADVSEMSELSDIIEREERTLAGLERALAVTAGRAQPAGTAVATIPRGSAPVPSAQRSQIIVNRREPPKADLIWKSLAAQFYCYNEKRSMDEVLAKHYAGNTELEYFMRAISSPADTTTPGWAAELVATTIGDYIESLQTVSIYAQLINAGNRFSFGRAGKVTLPYRAGGLTVDDLAGAWVAEGAPIPVKQTTLTSKTLTPHKLAVISTFTRELAMHSTPEIESLIRRYILADTAYALDRYLLDDQPASTTRPAGLLNGVTPVASSGAGLDNLIADIKAAVVAITAAGGGGSLVWIMNPADALGIQFMTSMTGEFLFPGVASGGGFLGSRVIVSTHQPAGTVILIDADSFASALGDTPAFDVSDVATLHMESATPLPIVGGTVPAPAPAVPVRSLWQTASIGVRMMQDLSWGMLRSGHVYVISGVDW